MKPAARAGDVHVCPAVDPGPIPHLGGAIAPASPDVRAGNQDAARHTDMAFCKGPVDSIQLGSPTVLVNNLMAARIFDPTVHGGAVAAGLDSVRIGEGSPNVKVIRRGHIYILVYSDSHLIVMSGVQEYYGTGASQAYVDRATRSINNTWSGTTVFRGETYTVQARIHGRLRSLNDEPNPMANQIEVIHTDKPPSNHRNWNPASQPVYGRRPGYQHGNEDTDGTLGIPHEFGHSMGLRDEYREIRHRDGSRTTIRTGPPGGLMGTIEPGARPTNANYDSLITGDGLWP